MASDMNNKNFVQDNKDSLKKKAEHLIIKGFPEKIFKLNELLETPYFKCLNDVDQDLYIPGLLLPPKNESNAKRQRLNFSEGSSNYIVKESRLYSLSNGFVPCNKPLSDLISLVKPYIRELFADSNLLKMWISFMIPKIEDGNNFGVSIQEVTLAEVQAVESEATAFVDQISNYFVSRAKIVSKIAKYPHVEDYRRAVIEIDEKEYLSLLLGICEIRNRYCSLHDIVKKNLEKIKNPRSSNAESLY